MTSTLVSLMLTLSLASAGPELIAHRGESADAPENTLAAFRLAWQRKVAAIDLDVHLTKDGRLAVCHDFDTKRCAGVAGKIRESLWDDLKVLDVYVWTVNDVDVALDLVQLGVDGITTDKAAWLRDELRRPIEE